MSGGESTCGHASSGRVVVGASASGAASAVVASTSASARAVVARASAGASAGAVVAGAGASASRGTIACAAIGLVVLLLPVGFSTWDVAGCLLACSTIACEHIDLMGISCVCSRG